MKKTRFFYEINYFLIVLLGWLLLFYKAVQVNQEQEKRAANTVEKSSLGIGIGVVSAGKMLLIQEQVQKGILKTGTFLYGIGTADQSLNEKKAEDEKTIRVLLMDSAYQSYYHSLVTVEQGGAVKTYTPDCVELEAGSFLVEGGEEGFYLPSIQRQENPPFYQGNLEIQKTNQGLLLINEVPLEVYLQSVVPSEMPSSYEEQALMAQAVCARTYAICQMEEGKLKETYGADVDDSVNFQVYNNFGTSPKTSQAVNDTRGKILCQNGKPVTAYYFSTSAGMTSTDEIWNMDPGASYLQSVACEFDQEEPWSRWQVEIPWEMLNERTRDLTGAGNLMGIQITKKSSSGAVSEMELLTENGKTTVEGEYDIRRFFCPAGIPVTIRDGSTAQGGNLLPSAYFELVADPGKSVKLTGGGLGHGVGMSQTAANEMAKEGYTWEEILHYFFRDITISELH